MSTWKKASKVNQKTHRERHQPKDRSHLGFLEKQKDYQRRARNENEKSHILKILKSRALDRNPDEFYFRMINSKIVGDEHKDLRKQVEHTPEQIKLMQTRDLKYINLRRTMEAKKVEKMKANLHFVDKSGQVPNTHIFFVESAKDFRNFDLFSRLNTHPFLIDRKSNRPRMEDLEMVNFPDIDQVSAMKMKRANQKMYLELENRTNREGALRVAQRKLELKRHLTCVTDGKPNRVKKATPDTPPLYKWKRQRKK